MVGHREKLDVLARKAYNTRSGRDPPHQFAEADAIWGAAAEVDTIGEQQLKQTQSGSSS